MNSYIFLTDEGYTFQPETEEEPVVIDSLQTIGTARGTDAMDCLPQFAGRKPATAGKKV